MTTAACQSRSLAQGLRELVDHLHLPPGRARATDPGGGEAAGDCIGDGCTGGTPTLP